MIVVGSHKVRTSLRGALSGAVLTADSRNYLKRHPSRVGEMGGAFVYWIHYHQSSPTPSNNKPPDGARLSRRCFARGLVGTRWIGILLSLRA